MIIFFFKIFYVRVDQEVPVFNEIHILICILFLTDRRIKVRDLVEVIGVSYGAEHIVSTMK